jgi:polysaccharide chain length determinant protein (PEP-CTERM system associated)
MTDIRVELLSHLAAVWQRRWLAMAVIWAVCLAGWGVVALLPSQYEAQARVYIDTDTLLGPLLRNLAVENDLDRRVQIMHRTLLSRPNLQQVAVATDLALKARTPAEEDQLYDALEKKIKITAQGANLFTISYIADQPALARSVVQALLTILVESNTGQNRDEMEKARKFVEKQIADYEERLRDMERRIAQFKADHVDELAGPAGFSARLEAARQQADTARTELADAQERRDRWRAQLQGLPRYVETDGAMQVIVGGEDPGQKRITEMQHNLDQLRLRFTDQHPDVIAATKALDEMRRQANQSPATGEGGVTARPRGHVSNPVYEQAQLRLLEAEQAADVAARHLAQAQAEESRLNKLATSAPAIEAQFADLTRDYNVQHHDYDELLSRREQARISMAVENNSTKILFRIIDPPRVPARPTGPRRLLFQSLVLAAGIVIGLGSAMMLYRLADPVTSSEALTERFRHKVLGSISLVRSADYGRRQTRQLVGIGVAMLALLMAYGVIALATASQMSPYSLVSQFLPMERGGTDAG